MRVVAGIGTHERAGAGNTSARCGWDVVVG